MKQVLWLNIFHYRLIMTVDNQVLYHIIGYLYYVIIIYNNFYDYCSLQEKKLIGISFPLLSHHSFMNTSQFENYI